MRFAHEPTVHVGKAWRIILTDLGLDAYAVLQRADLPQNLLDGQGSQISIDDYFSLWDAIAAESETLSCVIKLGRITAFEHFDHAILAATCSPNMNVAVQRLAKFKWRAGTFQLNVDITPIATKVSFTCKYRPFVPLIAGLTQLVLLLALARRATRSMITPIEVCLPSFPKSRREFETWFGCALTYGAEPSLTFATRDANKPFLTQDDQTWAIIEPSLRRRLAAAERDETVECRVVRIVFEMLPNGHTEIHEAANRLAMSTRSLQRRLAEEGTTWLTVLNDVHEHLANHYLLSTDLNLAEISFLLGYEDPNSLYRAFHRWKGSTPEAWRNKWRDAAETEIPLI